MRLIDADALKDEIHKDWDGVLVWDESGETTADEFERLVNDQPTVEPKHGKWIGKPIAGYAKVKCSECGNVFLNNNSRWNYCPDCGAKMEEET